MKKIIIFFFVLTICISFETFGQGIKKEFDGFYVKAYGLYDVGFYFPEEKAEFEFRDTNSFLTFGAEAGLYKSTFAVGLSLAHGNEFQETNKELRFGERNYTSYSRILITVRKNFIGSKPKSKIQAHLGGSAGGGYMLFRAEEGTGETKYNPTTGRDEYLTQNVTVSAAYMEAGIYAELGVKLKGRTSILLNYHLLDVAISSRNFGFNLAKTGLIIRF